MNETISRQQKCRFCTYGDSRFKKSLKRISQEAQSTGWFDKVTVYSPESLSQLFTSQFKQVLSFPKGGGYWIWKYEILMQELSQSEENDIIVYCDAGCTVNDKGLNRFLQYVYMLSHSDVGFVSFLLPYEEKVYTSRQIFESMGVSGDVKFEDSGILLATVLVLKKCPNTYRVLDEFYKTVLSDWKLITDFYNEGQQSYFIDNRHDQSILSIARKKHGSIILANEVDFGSFDLPHVSQYPFWATRIKE